MSARYARRSRFVAIAVGDLGDLVLSVLDSEERKQSQARPAIPPLPANVPHM